MADFGVLIMLETSESYGKIDELRSQMVGQWKEFNENWKALNLKSDNYILYLNGSSMGEIDFGFEQLDQLIKCLNKEMDFAEREYVKLYLSSFGRALEKIVKILVDCNKGIEAYAKSLAARTKFRAELDTGKLDIDDELIKSVNELIVEQAKILNKLYFINNTINIRYFKDINDKMRRVNEIYNNVNDDLKNSVGENKNREKKIDELIKKSDAMIRGATTAGLAKSLNEAKEYYETRRNIFMWCFISSIAVLAIVGVLLVGKYIPGPWKIWFASFENEDTLLTTIGRVVLLLPFIWLTAFFAKNYTEFFHLCREYAHKETLAKSVDGFKREAPKYEEEIAKNVFLEIIGSPGLKKSPSSVFSEFPVNAFLEKFPIKKDR